MSDLPSFPPRSQRSARGDLVRLHRALPGDQASLAVALLGFEREETQKAEKATPAVLAKEPDSSSDTSLPSSGLRTPFWRVEEVEHLSPAAPRRPAERKVGLTQEDAHNPGRSLFCRPPCPPIAPWSRVEPRLRAVLSGDRVSQEPDVDAVVRALGRGVVLRDIPRRHRRSWPDTLHLWLDRSDRHITVEEDQVAVARKLARLVGPAAISVRVLDPVTQACALAERGHFLPEGMPPGVVLVLGDLGACADAATARGWARAGELLARAGVRPVALVPVGLDRLDPRVAASWCAVPWQTQQASSLSDRQRAARADRLLRLASPAALIQPGLLRALRLLLPTEEADVGTEFDALTRPDVRAFDGTGLVLHEETSRRLRDAFAAEEPRALQEAVSDLIRAWHEGLPAELLRAETLAWHVRNRDVAPPGDLRDAVDFFVRVEASLSGSELLDAASWRRLLRATLAGLPASSYQQGELAPVLQSLWTLAHSDQSSAVVPEGVGTDGDDSAQLRRWSVRQVGDSLHLQPQDADLGPASEPLRPGSPLATLDLRGHLRVRSGGPQVQHQVRRGLSLPLSPGGMVELQGPSARVTVRSWTPEPWAVAAGRDEYGLWADLEVRGVVQRMRWIPPGRFEMGVHHVERYRLGNQGSGQEVELIRGFWLGDTPVTQRLWLAVMPNNPSEFRHDDRPVEQVNINACMGFCAQVAGLAPMLSVRLPTEYEWEYACRAGMEVDLWSRRPSTEGDRHIVSLDTIAWHEQNAQRQTWPVKGKVSNPWGLFDMLGNVYEWCDTEYSDRFPRPNSASGSPSSPDRRNVIRGGSWNTSAQLILESDRAGYFSVNRYADLGFRIAIGPATTAEHVVMPSGNRLDRAEQQPMPSRLVGRRPD